MKNATLRYIFINITYFAVFCGIHAYASVYLISKGFTNTQIGILLATANILSVVLQPLIAGMIDKPGPLTNRNVCIVCTGIMLAGSLALYFIKSGFAAIFIIYALVYMIQMAYQPLIIAMNFEYTLAGAKIRFGLARGLGSLGFALTSIFFARLVEYTDITVIQLVDAGIMLIALVLLYFFKLPGTVSVAKEPRVGSDRRAHNNLFDFIRTYPKFMCLIVGIICFFFAHNAINDYLFQIILPIGGDETKMGYAIFIAAALELPTMACIGLLLKKISGGNLLRISGVFFLIKTFLLLTAVNMIGVYVSQACQIAAYALLIPAAAYYVNDVMEEFDKVKGQAFINVAVTLGGVFSNLICGRILDVHGPHTMLILALAVSGAGLAITWFSVEKKRSVQQ